MNWLKQLFKPSCTHEWYYARGRSRGIISGKQRPGCIRRECRKCHKQQEISHFQDCFKSNCGDTFMGKPNWQDGFSEPD